MRFNLKLGLIFVSVLTLWGCSTTKYDYTNFKESKPKSILIIPPLNSSPDVRATYSFLSNVTVPLSEAGYYVFPVALVDQSFKENGLVNPGEMHQAPLNKIREVFGADSVLYITINQYGSSYTVIASEVRVTAHAKLVDAKSGKLLWEGKATASDAEGQNNSGGLAALLVTAVIKQLVGSIGDPGYPISKIAAARLLNPGPNGILHGHRSPKFNAE